MSEVKDDIEALELEVRELEGHAIEPAPGLLPGERLAHPAPFQYVMIAVVLVVITALEVGLYYLEGDMPDGLLIALLLTFAAMKFFLVASWYMHLRTDRLVYRRFFVIGILAAIVIYGVVLLSLHVLD